MSECQRRTPRPAPPERGSENLIFPSSHPPGFVVCRIVDLHGRIHRGVYWAQPSLRAWIPKADGRQRPLGIAALEDKIVQQAVKTVLEQIYEVDFLGFSYGFRPWRSCHNALDALWVGIMQRKAGWVLDADIRGFFDNIDHEWMMKFLEHRIADRRVLRLIRKWLRAGVSEDGQWSRTTVGTPQGSVISPLLANVFLHYVFDLWVNQWRRRHARGEVIIVRYADDFVMGFQHRDDAEQCPRALRKRLAEFGLELHPEKTRLIESGRFAAERREKRGEGTPETFNFLGFTHCCGKTRKGVFTVKRKSIAKGRVQRTLIHYPTHPTPCGVRRAGTCRPPAHWGTACSGRPTEVSCRGATQCFPGVQPR